MLTALLVALGNACLALQIDAGPTFIASESGGLSPRMATTMDVLDRLELSLARSREDARPIVVLTCGIAGTCTTRELSLLKVPDRKCTDEGVGSGKSTLAKAIAFR